MLTSTGSAQNKGFLQASNKGDRVCDPLCYFLYSQSLISLLPSHDVQDGNKVGDVDYGVAVIVKVSVDICIASN